MKKLLGIVVLGLIVLPNIVEAKYWHYKKGQIVEKEIVWNLFVNLYETFRKYKRTAHRDIPIVGLTVIEYEKEK